MSSQFSFYKGGIKNIIPTVSLTVGRAILKIKSDEFKDDVQRLRNATDRHVKEVIKNHLNYFTFSGTFKKRHLDDMIKHSGLIAIDFDPYKKSKAKEPTLVNPRLLDQFDQVRAELLADKYTHALFTSPSGTGYKVLIKIDPKLHADSFLHLEVYYKKTYSLVVDPSGKDHSRACYASWDPEAFHNESSPKFILSDDTKPAEKAAAEPKPISPEKEGINRAYKPTAVVAADREKDLRRVQHVVKQVVEQKLDITGSYDDWLLIAFCLAIFGDEIGRPIFHEVSQFHPEYTPLLADEKFDNAVRTLNPEKLKTPYKFFTIAKAHNISCVLPKPEKPKVAPAAPAQSIITATERGKFLDRIRYVADQVERNQIDMTDMEDDKKIIAFSLSIFGDEGHSLFTRIMKLSPGYSKDDATALWNDALKHSTLKTPKKFFDIAGGYGLDTKLPRTIEEVKKEKELKDFISDDEHRRDYEKYAIWEHNGTYWSLGNQNIKYNISNFKMKILYFVEASDEQAFRVIEITNIHGHTKTLKLSTDDFEAVGTFKKAVARKGNFLWKGTDVDLVRLKDKLQRDEAHTNIVTLLGWNKRYKFYAWANGLYLPETNEFKAIDQYGIVQLHIENRDGVKVLTNFFIPALSKIFEDKDDMFINEKKFVYRESNFNFEQWARQYCLVYGVNGQVGLVFYVMAIMSDIIFKEMGGRFPIFFPYGKRGTGKGKLIESLMRLFGDKQESIGLGGNSTTIGFLRVLAQLVNALVHLDEYKNSIDKKKIETCKEIYDRRPQTRGQKTMGFETNTVPVNSAAIMSGQEMPTAEPALFTRCILTILTKTTFTQDEVDEMKKLMRMEAGGLSCITVQLLKHRPLFAAQWAKIFDNEQRILKKAVNNNEVDERMIDNYAALVATAELIGSVEELPFNVIAFREMAHKKMQQQFFILKGSDDVSKFWQIIEALVTDGVLREGTHYKLINGEMQIRIQDVVGKYAEAMGKLKGPIPLDKATLENYLQNDTESFMARTKKTFSDGQRWCMIFKYAKLDIDVIKETDEKLRRAKYKEMGVLEVDELAEDRARKQGIQQRADFPKQEDDEEEESPKERFPGVILPGQSPNRESDLD